MVGILAGIFVSYLLNNLRALCTLLLERIVKASSNKGDIVLDPFSGVGTTFAVCQKLERNFIGFEINPECVEIIKKRCG